MPTLDSILRLGAVALATVAIGAAAVGGDSTAPDSPDSSEAQEAADGDRRRERFELRYRGDVVGIASTFRGRRGGVVQAELRLDMFPIRTSIVHVEESNLGAPRLVWRERRPQSGRTLLVDWGPDGELSSVDWSGGDALRRTAEPTSGALLPLYLVGRVRAGEWPRGTFDVFDPLSGGVEEWNVRVERVRFFAFSRDTRRLIATRADGTLAGEYLFHGSRLIGFRYQSGGPVAVCTTRERHESLGRVQRNRRAAESGLDERPSPASAPAPRGRVINGIGGR